MVKMLDLVLEMLDFVLKMLDFVLKMLLSFQHRRISAMVEHSFAAMDSEIKWKWTRGLMVRMSNGLYAPVKDHYNVILYKCSSILN